MADRMTKEQRHRCMSHIKGRDTKPGLLVHNFLFITAYNEQNHVEENKAKMFNLEESNLPIAAKPTASYGLQNNR